MADSSSNDNRDEGEEPQSVAPDNVAEDIKDEATTNPGKQAGNEAEVEPGSEEKGEMQEESGQDKDCTAEGDYKETVEERDTQVDKHEGDKDGETDDTKTTEDDAPPSVESEAKADNVATTEAEEDSGRVEDSPPKERDSEREIDIEKREEESELPASEAEAKVQDKTDSTEEQQQEEIDVNKMAEEDESGGVRISDEGEMVESGVGIGVGLEPLEDIVEEEEETDEEAPPVDREELLTATKETLVEQDRLKSLSAQLQHKIAEYLAKKKTEERPDPGRNVTDQEKRYSQCMAALEVLEKDLATLRQKSELQEANLLVFREQKLNEVQKAIGEFATYKKSTATTAVHSRTGRRLQAQEVEQFQGAEDKKELELIQVRLENIKLQNKISKLEAQIKEKEQLAEGLHMIDFEQLKINNVDLNEKIEERNEDILKLRKKVTSTVQVLTHVKEKLQFLQAENGEKRNSLRNIDEVVAKKRDHLTRTKQARDSLRMDNLRLKQKGGLVGHPALLGDFEERKDQNDELKEHLERLQQRHSELTVVCDGLRKKVEQARAINPRNI